MSSVITGPGIKCLDDPNFSFDEPAAAPTAAPAASAVAAVPAVAAAPSNTANPSDRPSGIPQPKKPSYRNSRFSYCEASVSATCLDGSSLCFEVVFRVEKLSWMYRTCFARAVRKIRVEKPLPVLINIGSGVKEWDEHRLTQIILLKNAGLVLCTAYELSCRKNGL